MPVDRRNRFLFSVLAAILLADQFCAAGDAPAREAGSKSSDGAAKRLVYQAKSVPIVELAATIREACRAGKDLQDVTFSAMATSNSTSASRPSAIRPMSFMCPSQKHHDHRACGAAMESPRL